MAKHMAAERSYEALFISPVETTQKSIDAFIEKVKATLTQVNATIRSVQVWGRRRLTYAIKHQRDGLYIYVDFNGTRESVEALKTLFRVSDVVLRHMITERVELRPPYVRKIPMDGVSAPASAAGVPTNVDQAAAPVTPAASATPPSAQ